MSKSKSVAEEFSLPAVPNFVWVDRNVEPPKNVLLLLQAEDGMFMYGEWDGRVYKDSSFVLIEEAFGTISKWCVLLAPDGYYVSTSQ